MTLFRAFRDGGVMDSLFLLFHLLLLYFRGEVLGPGDSFYGAIERSTRREWHCAFCESKSK
jgi:hypothetical protein